MAAPIAAGLGNTVMMITHEVDEAVLPAYVAARHPVVEFLHDKAPGVRVAAA